MQIHWAFHSCGDRIRARSQTYWADKSERLQRLLTPFNAELQHLNLVVDRQAHPEGYKVRAVLNVPTRTIVVEEQSRYLRPALDRVMELLGQEIKQQLARLRHARHSGRTTPEEVEVPSIEE